MELVQESYETTGFGHQRMPGLEPHVHAVQNPFKRAASPVEGIGVPCDLGSKGRQIGPLMVGQLKLCSCEYLMF